MSRTLKRTIRKNRAKKDANQAATLSGFFKYTKEQSILSRIKFYFKALFGKI